MVTSESVGEDLIADFLEDKNIGFERQVKITNLKEDTKEFREADFFLPQYGVYIEFLGKWHDAENIARYKQKMAVYRHNQIPCIYLWPDNLGTLEWMLKRRMREQLLSYKRNWSVFRFEFAQAEEKLPLLLILFMTIIAIGTGNISTIGIWVCALTLVLGLVYSIEAHLKRLDKIKKSGWVHKQRTEMAH
jgi:hypothetical protein